MIKGKKYMLFGNVKMFSVDDGNLRTVLLCVLVSEDFCKSYVH